METKPAKRKTALLAAALAAGACLPGWGVPPVLTRLRSDAVHGMVFVRGRGTADACCELQWSPALGETAEWSWVGETQARTNGVFVFEVADEIFARPGFYRVWEKQGMSARDIARSGGAQGMKAYSRMLWDERIVMPAGKADCEIHLSGDTKDPDCTYGESIGADVDLLGRNATKDNQRAYLRLPSRYWDAPVEDAKWVYQTACDPATGEDRLVGRCAYAIFDVSGGVDVNLLARETLDGSACGETNRSNIRYFSKEAANCLEDVLSIGGIGSQVERYGGFNSFQAMRKNLSNHVDLENLNNLVPHSKSAFRGTYFDTGDGMWTIPVDSYDLSQYDWEKLLAGSADARLHRNSHVMQDSLKNLTYADSRAIAKAIMDFTSDDIVPQGLDYPSVKDVPMLNEIQFTVKLTEDRHSGENGNPDYSTYTLKVTLDLETWFPFPVSNNEGKRFQIPAPLFRLVRNADYGGGNSIVFRYTLTGVSGYTLTRPDFSATAEDYIFSASWNDGKPQQMRDAFTYEIPIKATCSGNGWPYSGDEGRLPQGLALILQQQGTTVFTVKSGGFPVDEVELVLVNQKFIQLKKESSEYEAAWEVLDPRMNHLPDFWTFGEEGGSLGEWNETAKQAIQQNLGLSDPQSGDFAMYCRNGPMETPGDLGFIPVMGTSKSSAKAWKMLDLYSLDAAWLMRQLASKAETEYVYDDPINGRRLRFPDTLPIYTNGTINPNTPLTNVLQSVFTMTAEGIPGWNNTSQNKKKLSSYDAKTIATRIIGYRSKGVYAVEESQSLGQGYDFASGSDWVTAFADSTWHKQLEYLFDRPKNVREGLIRQTWGLFRPEDNLFVMVVIGQGIREGPGGTLGVFDEANDEIVDEKREVLLVWCDPFPVDGNRDCDMQIISRTELGD